MTLPQDLKVRELIYDFLIRLGSALRVDGRTILAATVYINRFYMRIPITTSKYFVVCAAVSISGKLHDCFRSPDKIAMAACVLRNPNKQIDQHSPLFWQWRDQLIYREELILKVLNFELDVELPYDYCEEFLSQKDKVSDNKFYEKLPEIIKYLILKMELVSGLPILVAFDSRTLFGTMLVLTIKEAHSRFPEVDSLHLPKAYLKEKVHTTTQDVYACYKYILTLRKVCADPKLPSHRAVVKKITSLDKKDFLHIAEGGDKQNPAALLDAESDKAILDDL